MRQVLMRDLIDFGFRKGRTKRAVISKEEIEKAKEEYFSRGGEVTVIKSSFSPASFNQARINNIFFS